MLPETQKLFSESQRRSYEKGIVDGTARGEARALLKILAQRGLAVSDNQRRRISECVSLATLDRWLDRALSVTSVDEMFG